MPHARLVRIENSKKREKTHSAKTVFLGVDEQINKVFSQGRRELVEAATDLYPYVINLGNFDSHLESLSQVEVIFSTWGMPRLSSAQLDQLPSLQAVFYAAGSVQSFAEPLLERGVTVVSAWQANAVPVAEYTLAQILLSTKGTFRNIQDYRSPAAKSTAFKGKGNFGETISILGAGAIGRRVIELLRPFNLRVIVFDPFLSKEKADALHVEPVSLEDAFLRGYVVSNHLANLPETRKLLTKAHFASMRPDATFINTGRGATVDETGLIEVFQERKDLTALLDVTDPEPPAADSLLYQLPNIILTTHIAGSLGDEVVRMADYCLEEFARWSEGKPLQYEVLPSMLRSMA